MACICQFCHRTTYVLQSLRSTLSCHPLANGKRSIIQGRSGGVPARRALGATPRSDESTGSVAVARHKRSYHVLRSSSHHLAISAVTQRARKKSAHPNAQIHGTTKRRLTDISTQVRSQRPLAVYPTVPSWPSTTTQYVVAAPHPRRQSSSTDSGTGRETVRRAYAVSSLLPPGNFRN